VSGNDNDWVNQQARIKNLHGISDAGMSASGLSTIKTHDDALAARAASDRALLEEAMGFGRDPQVISPSLGPDPDLQARADAARAADRFRPESLLAKDPEFQRYLEKFRPRRRNPWVTALVVLVASLVVPVALYIAIGDRSSWSRMPTGSELDIANHYATVPLAKIYESEFRAESTQDFRDMPMRQQMIIEGAWRRVSADLSAIGKLSPDAQAFFDRVFRERLQVYVDRGFPSAIADLERLEKARPLR